jgi:hypothetical protein
LSIIVSESFAWLAVLPQQQIAAILNEAAMRDSLLDFMSSPAWF